MTQPKFTKELFEEMLAALTQATQQFEHQYEYTSLDGYGALILKLRAVIAKAEGLKDGGDNG